MDPTTPITIKYAVALVVALSTTPGKHEVSIFEMPDVASCAKAETLLLALPSVALEGTAISCRTDLVIGYGAWVPPKGPASARR